jgi:hypothetical protein
VLLLLAGMLQELFRDALGVNAPRHIIVTFGSKDAKQLGGQYFVQYLQNGFQVSLVALGDGFVLHVLARSAPDFLNMRQERSVALCLLF